MKHTHFTDSSKCKFLIFSFHLNHQLIFFFKIQQASCLRGFSPVNVFRILTLFPVRRRRESGNCRGCNCETSAVCKGTGLGPTLMSLCLSISIFISASVSFCLSVSISISVSSYLSLYLYFYFCLGLFLSLSFCLSLYLYFYCCLCLFLSICLAIGRSVFL